MSKIKRKDLIAVMTCGACPEQYDVYLAANEYRDSINIGYLRLRHGYFYALYRDEKVYEAWPVGDGIFASEEEREFHLKKALKAIKKAYNEEQ